MKSRAGVEIAGYKRLEKLAKKAISRNSHSCPLTSSPQLLDEVKILSAFTDETIRNVLEKMMACGTTWGHMARCEFI